MCENGMYFGLIICIVCMFLDIYFSTISFSLLPSLKPQKKVILDLLMSLLKVVESLERLQAYGRA